MDRNEYLALRNSNKINSQIIYSTLLLNKTFKVKSVKLFIAYSKKLRAIVPNFNSIIIKEFKRLNDIKFSITTIHDKAGKEISFH